MTNLLQIVQPLELQSRKFLNAISETTIKNDAEKEKACVFLKEINDFKKSVDKQKKEQTEPLKIQIKDIDENFKPALDFLKEADALTRTKINSYLDEERKRQEIIALEAKKQQEEEALKKIEEMEKLKNEAGKYDKATQEALVQSLEEKQNKEFEASAKVHKVNLSSASSTVRTVWTFEIEDISQIPVEFLEVNSKAVNEAIRQGQREIKGLKIFQKSVVAVK